MSAFRRVEDSQAGSGALGILIPPGRATVVILRPRALPWDLLLTRDDSPLKFREIFRDEAARAAHAVEGALVSWAEGGTGEVVPQADAGGYKVCCRMGRFSFVACERRPGSPYEPHCFRGATEAEQAALALRTVLHPPPGSTQEIYCNMRHFEK